jgi:p-hydroxybenzoate 3-monooxygenase
LYPQTDVFIDLDNARDRDGGDVRFGVKDTEVSGVDGDSPLIRFIDADGTECEIRCEVVAGADGSRSICRFLIPEIQRVHYFKEYPFAWFGVLSESPFNAPELIYAHSDRGFALISQRTETIQRLYFQCPIDEDVELWSNQQIWDELQARVDGDDGFELKRGPIFDRTLLRFRSFVAEPMRWGRLVLAGDAAHTVPPTGAKGLNLAINDVRILHECLVNALGRGGSLDALDAYGPRALDRIWKSENFSYWMTQMLHTPVDGVSFDFKRQIGELTAVASSKAGRTYLAESYTGWPDQKLASS